MTILPNFHEFSGRHYETAAIRNYLAYRGYKAPHTGKAYSEALMMGVGGGAVMGYFSFVYEGYFPLCRILTRNTFDPVETMFARLGFVQENIRTASPEKAEENLKDVLASGIPAIVWADAHSLGHNGQGEYPGIWMMSPILVYGIDDAAGEALVAGRAAVPFHVPLDVLRAARGRIKKEKHRMLTLSPPNPDKLVSAVQAGIWDCIRLYTEAPPHGTKNNFGLQAFRFWAELLTRPKARLSWARVFPPGPEMYAGLRGAYHSIQIFDGYRQAERGLYAEFLEEAALILGNDALKGAAARFRSAGKAWDALGTALLPDEIAPFRETRELLERRERVYVDQGAAALDEIVSCEARLAEIRKSMETDFPLSGSEAEQMCAGIAEKVLAVHDVEEDAVRTLKGAMGKKA